MKNYKKLLWTAKDPQKIKEIVHEMMAKGIELEDIADPVKDKTLYNIVAKAMLGEQ